MEVILANPRGFCAGVDRAIDIVKAALVKYGAPVYVRHEVVHNRLVVDTLKKLGARFVEELSEVPDDSIVIFSAHGVSQAVRVEAENRNLKLVFDATCPLVSKVHMEVARYSKKGAEVVLIGHEGHVEVIGTMGQYQNPEGAIYLVESIEDVEKLLLRDPKNCMYATQTTLSVTDTQAIIEALQKKFPDIEGPKKEDICYATQNRQDAVRLLTDYVDLILVVGSKNSSNSNRLRELAEQRGKPGFLIDSYEDIQMSWFDGIQRVGITAGASAPESLVEGVVQFLKDTFEVTHISKLTGIEENVHFTLPKDLRDVPLEKAFI